MKTGQIEKIVRKVEELKALFIFGQRVMPFLEDLFYFIQEIAPLLDEINSSLKESSKKMPKASNQLNKVTEATELATTEILDMVDAIGIKLNGILTNTNRFKSYADLQDDLSSKMKKRISQLEQKYPDDSDIQGMKDLWEKVDQASNMAEPLKNVVGIISEIRMLAGNIMISLQVQDITSQQIAAVNSLIGNVQGKLNILLTALASDSMGETIDITKLGGRKVAFDSNAEYTTAGSRQHLAEEVMSEMETTAATEQVNPDEIFAQQNAAPQANESASQDDIDALFK